MRFQPILSALGILLMLTGGAMVPCAIVDFFTNDGVHDLILYAIAVEALEYCEKHELAGFVILPFDCFL